jgi:two-component system sensor histidine kinase AlgZ
MPTTFLPDFCGLRVVFAVVVIGEMLALVLSLAPAVGGDRWSDLGLVSLYVQWVALTGIAVLCFSPDVISRA